MGFGAVIGLIHALGFIVSLSVFISRTGYSAWYGVGLKVLLISPEWFVVSMAKALFWEAVLVFWLANGQQPSHWRVPRGSRSGRVVWSRQAAEDGEIAGR